MSVDNDNEIIRIAHLTVDRALEETRLFYKSTGRQHQQYRRLLHILARKAAEPYDDPDFLEFLYGAYPMFRPSEDELAVEKMNRLAERGGFINAARRLYEQTQGDE